jgi:hypothetical protein
MSKAPRQQAFIAELAATATGHMPAPRNLVYSSLTMRTSFPIDKWFLIFLLLTHRILAIFWVDAPLMLITRETGVPGLMVDETGLSVAEPTCQYWLVDPVVMDLPMRAVGVVAPTEIFHGFKCAEGLDLVISVRESKPVRRKGV